MAAPRSSLPRSLLDHAKSGRYRAPPARRVHIPKGDGKQTRPIGIPTFEDKVLQRAVTMVLEAIYEQDFFDTVDRGHLREILHQRVRDGVLLRLIGKWLNAGVQEGGEPSYPATGTPQGGVASPLLANIYLHEVLDAWFEREVKPRLRGRLIDSRYPTHRRDDGDGSRSGTFDLLGFTHYWGRSRRGYWVVKRKTAKDRRSRATRSINQWCRRNRHRPIREQHRILVWKVRGHHGYYGLIGNAQWLWTFHLQVIRSEEVPYRYRLAMSCTYHSRVMR